MKKIVILGAGGFIGGHLATKLKSMGWQHKIEIEDGLADTYAYFLST